MYCCFLFVHTAFCLTDSLGKHLRKRKGLFWLMVSDISVCDWLAPLLWGLCQGRQHIMVGVHGKTKPFTLWRPGSKKKERRKTWHSSIALQGMLPMTSLPPSRPHLLKVPPPNSTAGWRPRLQYMGLWRTFQIDTVVHRIKLNL
jgi:hypothetical protein